MKQTFDRACASLLLFMAFQTAITLTFYFIKAGS